MFKPSREQARAKAAFHAKLQKNPLLGDPESLPVQKMEQLAGVKSLVHWMKEDGFKDWFLNANYNRELLESAVEVAIKEAVKILEAPSDGEKGSPKPSDKLAAMKILLEYAGYAPKGKDKAEYQDKDIANMDESNLDKMIQKALGNNKKLLKSV
jgi:hypothetical protein